jgi:hypothetical protein
MLQAAGITPAELARHMGQQLPVDDRVDIDAVHRRPEPAGQAPVEARPALSDRSRQVIDLADRPEGISVADVMSEMALQEAQAHRYCATLAQSRHLIRVKKPGVRAMRFFARPAHALAWAESDAVAPSLAPKPARVALSETEAKALETNTKKRAAARKAKPPMGERTERKQDEGTVAPGRIDDSRMRPQGQAVIPAGLKPVVGRSAPGSRIEALPALPADPRWPSFGDEWKRLRGEAAA